MPSTANLSPTILHESDEFIILNKPAGWLSIPGRTPEEQVITQWLENHLKQPAWVVHRLDRFTSGIILFAKTKEAHKNANHWFLKREVKKIYHFFASPPPSRPAIQIKTPIQGKPSQSLFEVLEKGPHAFYGKATPLTGRFHQIREHASEGGFPLLGDKPYHGAMTWLIDGVKTEVPRIFLHAESLTLPFGVFQAPLPKDMLKWKQEILK